ncbi:MAG: nitrate reductase [Verrucomicrobiales bacterium]|nr:nitrate reductase [Verrucomicrobiales bacterium]
MNLPVLRAFTGPLTRELVLRPNLGGLGSGLVPDRLNPDSTTSLTCGFCATGCSLDAHLVDDSAVNLSPSTHYPVNLGMACPKGWEALTPLDAEDRGVTPLLMGKPVDWSQASQEFCSRMKRIIAEHGPDAVAVLSTGQIVTEEMALLGALTKFGMGLRHLDSNTRQCMATAHVAYKESFGYDAPPFTYADFEESDVVIFIGANPCIAHPIMWQRVMMNCRSPKIVVIDPRRTETAMAATHHYPIQPKSDLRLLYGLAALLLDRGAIDRDFIGKHTSGFEEFADFLAGFTTAATVDATGLTREQLEELTDLIANNGRVSFWWTMGVNQGHESTRTAQAIINLALMTGNIGRPGTGANSITGQCNAMGSRLYANATSLMGGYQFSNPAHRTKVADILDIPESVIPDRQGLAYDQIIEGISAGRIKALWVLATNPAHSWIDSGACNRALEKLELLVVQDMYPTTETARRAHLFLPAAGWGEKDGTFINAERRFGVVSKVRRAPGLALSDFNILRLIAHHWGCGPLLAAWSSPAAVFEILKRLSKDQPSDITGISDYDHLRRSGGIQWPWTATGEGEPPTERRLFEDGIFHHPDGRARFIFECPRAMPETTSRAYPFLLLTGRGSSAQWHTNSRTGKSAILRQLHPNFCYIELNPADAGALGLKNQQRIKVVSRRGTISATAVLTDCVQAGQCFMPMHFAEVNHLTCPNFDAHSRQPGYKAAAIRLEPLDGDGIGPWKHQ